MFTLCQCQSLHMPHKFWHLCDSPEISLGLDKNSRIVELVAKKFSELNINHFPL